MTPAATEDLARTVIDLGMKLPPDARETVALELMESVDFPPEDPEVVKRAWQEELARRVKAIDEGKVKTYSVAETMAYLRQVIAEQSPS
ncbi:MAG: addiction module protein [Gemmataceae bacterium]